MTRFSLSADLTRARQERNRRTKSLRFLIASPWNMRASWLISAVVVLSACTRGDPPSWDASTGSLAVTPLPPPPVITTSAPGALGDAAAPKGDPDPGTLPQTRERPESTGAGFQSRVDALVRAIVADDPSLAIPAFFPVTAYAQVKAVSNPALDWERRLIAAYKRDIHAIHQRLGASAAKATFARVEVPAHAVRWVEPDEESNRLGYFRVYGARVVLDVAGRQEVVEIKSLISWRGEWYVVHLSGFK